MAAPKKYPDESRERATRLAVEARQDPARKAGALQRIGEQLGINPETLRGWVKQAEIDADHAPGVTTAEAQRIKDLEAEVRELRRANEILKTASVNSTRQRNNASSLSAGVSKSRVFRGLEFNRAATASRSAWVRSFMLTPLGKY
jgi:transposase